MESNPTMKNVKDSTVGFMKNLDKTVGSWFSGFVQTPEPLVF
jgi:hypothetical protein